MATRLEKDVVRESEILINGKELNVTLASSQEIILSIKGKGGASVSIGIQELWDKLYGLEEGGSSSGVVGESADDSPVVSLYDLRTRFCVSLDVPTLTKVDGIMAEFVNEHKEKIRVREQNKAVLKKKK